MAKKLKTTYLWEFNFGTIVPRIVYAISDHDIQTEAVIAELNKLCMRNGRSIPIPTDIQAILGKFNLTILEPKVVFHNFTCTKYCDGWHLDLLSYDYPDVLNNPLEIVKSAVDFYKEATKRSDIDGIMKSLAGVGLGDEFDELVESGAIPEEENSGQYIDAWLNDRERK